ncbi:MAG: beta strand repeat-containing protein [Capsulimonadaceae bacterium]
MSFLTGTSFRIATLALALCALPASAASPTYTNIFQFSGATNASAPGAPLIEAANGNYYGTAEQGGANNYGAIYELTPTSTTPTILYTFSGTDGSEPGGALLQGADGNLYGVTESGGTASSGTGSGTVFKITTGGTLTSLHTFTGSDGTSPVGALIQGTDGFLYGTAESGSTGNNGLVFKVWTDGTQFTILHRFAGTDGANPIGSLVQGPDGYLYGTTFNGGATQGGTIFKMESDGTSFSDLYSFAGQNNSAQPDAGVTIGPDGNLYGTTAGATGSFGTVYTIGTDGSGFNTLHTFLGTDGQSPKGNLIVGNDNNLYGTTFAGGTVTTGTAEGTLFSISTDGKTFTSLQTLVGGNSDGANIGAALLQATTATFYGATEAGGPANDGTLFTYVIPTLNPSPIGLSAEDGPADVTLTWSVFPGATSYNVYRGTASGAEGTTAVATNVTTTTYLDTGLSNNSTYFYEVTAVPSTGETAPSAQVAATPMAVHLSVQAPSVAGAGTPFQITVTAEDSNNNQDLTFTDTIKVTSSDPTAVLPPAAALDQGTNKFTVTLNTLQLQSLTITDVQGAAPPVTVDITVTNGGAEAFVISAPPTEPPGKQFAFTVTAQDADGNTAYSYNGTVQFSSSDTQAVFSPIAAKITNGVGGPYYVTLESPGIQTITATDSTSNISNSATVDVIDLLLITFNPGIQMISAPYDYSDYSMAGIFNVPISTDYVWYPQDFEYIASPNVPADTIRPGVAYWVNLATAASLYELVLEPTDITQPYDVPIYAGWNMIADPFALPMPYSEIEVASPLVTNSPTPLLNAMSQSVIGPTLYTIAPGATSYTALAESDSSTLVPYTGYWIFSQGDATLVFEAQ